MITERNLVSKEKSENNEYREDLSRKGGRLKG